MTRVARPTLQVPDMDSAGLGWHVDNKLGNDEL